MLKDTTLLIQWNSNNKKYFLSKGYIFTSYRDYFQVKISDLNPNSSVKVDVYCDRCGRLLNMTYKLYILQFNHKGKRHNKGEIICKKCTKIPIDTVKKHFIELGLIPLFNEYNNANESLQCECVNHRGRIITTKYAYIQQKHNPCYSCSRPHGIEHPRWVGAKKLNIYLRMQLQTWNKKSKNLHGNRCLITGDKNNIEIHHLDIGFVKIRNETLEELNLPILESVNEYSQKDLKNIAKLFKEKHFKYGLGIPLQKELHTEFHKIYGYVNYTRNDFILFIKDKYPNYDIPDVIISS